MIILLTGRPGMGKSTVVKKFVGLYKAPAHWVVTSGILRPQGGRAGFMATNSQGEQRIISHKTAIASDVVIGENHVDIAAVNSMFANVLDKAKPGGPLTIVDEIGPIQLLSPAFSKAWQRVFSSRADIIATIHYQDERLAVYRNSPHALLIHVTVANRDMLPAMLVAIAQARSDINQLSESQQTRFYTLAKRYVDNLQLVQLQKLCDNALWYALQGHIIAADNDQWQVSGRHGTYLVQQHDDRYTCTCDLFNGRGKYAGAAGECSHIQAVSLQTAAG